jgi:hypothetical protein
MCIVNDSLKSLHACHIKHQNTHQRSQRVVMPLSITVDSHPLTLTCVVWNFIEGRISPNNDEY